MDEESRRAAVIVAHPDDETLWCGGQILRHADWRWYVYTLCRASDADRAPRFRKVLRHLGAVGGMADLDDTPAQPPLPLEQVRQTILALLPPVHWDVVLTHGPWGEYQRHRRHEECCRAVVSLWYSGRLNARELWMFAYESDAGPALPRLRDDAEVRDELPEPMVREKQAIVSEIYGFKKESWEYRAIPAVEGFWRFDDPQAAAERLNHSELLL
jgi:LmbE family N-acetylglucosaminyl deacetylase